MSRRGSANVTPRPAAAVAVGAIGFFMVLLDGSALNVALPDIEQNLHITLDASQWVVTVYTLPLASLLLTSGSIADRLGTRTLYVISIAGFTAASALCAASPDLLTLLVGRVLQGGFAAGMLPTTLTITARAYSDERQRAQAITVWGAIGGIAMAAGPLAGGALTEWFGWRAIFLINLPIGALTAIGAYRWLPAGKRSAARVVDLLGQLLGLTALLCLTAALIQSGAIGWDSTLTVGLLCGSVVAGVAFVLRERSASRPLVPPSLFNNAPFAAMVAGGFAFQFSAYGLQFAIALYLQQRWDLSPLATGAAFVPFAICWAFGNAVLNRRLLRHGPKRLITAGSLVAAAGTATLLLLGSDRQLTMLVAATIVTGLGCGVFAPSLNAVAVTAVNPDQTGLASGVLNTSRQAGMSVAIALLGALLASPATAAGLHRVVTVVTLGFLTVTALTLRGIPPRGRLDTAPAAQRSPVAP